MKCPLVLSALLGAVISNANAFTLNLDFDQGKPKTMDFSFAISTGSCNSIPAHCSYINNSYTGIKDVKITKFMRDMNSTFDPLTPVEDNSHNPTNYVHITVSGGSNACHVNLLGKQKIHIKMNSDGSCIIS